MWREDLSLDAFGAHMAVVEVSRETGAIKILKYVGVHDSGKIINPMLAEGQVHGAIAQGIGQALFEGMVYSPEGQPLSGSLMDYVLARADQMPDFILDTLETPSPLTSFGVKGIGELPTLAAPVAVVNAVMDALSQTGVRNIDAPLSPERVWRQFRWDHGFHLGITEAWGQQRFYTNAVPSVKRTPVPLLPNSC